MTEEVEKYIKLLETYLEIYSDTIELQKREIDQLTKVIEERNSEKD